jgi:hypothetical protein
VDVGVWLLNEHHYQLVEVVVVVMMMERALLRLLRSHALRASRVSSSSSLLQRGAAVRRSSQQLRAFLSASSLGIAPKSMELPSRVACPLILQMNLGFSGIWLGARSWNSYETWFLHHLQENSSKNKSQGGNNPFEAKLF